MPDQTVRNQIDSEGRGRSMRKGDVPEALGRRYYLDEKGGPGLGFYADARVQSPAFRDLGARLISGRSDPNAIRDMAGVAQHRGWTVVSVHGDKDFRREMWLATTALGIEARGYQPTARDHQELERRVAQSIRRGDREAARSAHDSAGRSAQATMRVVEAVVRGRVADSPGQERVLHAARERIASWLERGARLQPIDLTTAHSRDRNRERQRG